MKFLKFLLSHSIYVACCAVALSLQTTFLLQLPVPYSVYLLVFFSTLSGYNFYWLVNRLHHSKKKISLAFIKQNNSLVIVFSISSIATLYLLAIHLNLIFYIFISGMLTIMYSYFVIHQIKILGYNMLKSFLLAFTWAFTTMFVPLVGAQNANGIPISINFLLLFALRFLFMLLLCMIFDKKDVADESVDVEEDFTAKNNKTIGIFYNYILAFYFLSVFIFCYYNLSWSLALAFVIIGFVSFALFRLTDRKRSYLFYYFYVDGLMLCCAGASYLATFYHYNP